MKNKVRIVKMVLNKPIPSYVIIGGYKTGCTYEGQQATCRHCNQPVHSGSCSAKAATSLLSSSSSEPSPEPMHKNDTHKTSLGSHTQQTKPATGQTNSSSSSSLSSSLPSSPRQTKQRPAVEMPATGSGFAAVLEQLSN